ncbi:hypothetical protein C486_01674 [Natrinema gari JCM 14663]|uniref:Uncharacterized protein n=1 Tax=Natrinema gari JCM 14663 TaxID=1230459 RepID=L9ZFC4_9EURY|nr:hypothetical protein C486_01674 [Natrinema gari JCM 14663]
MEMSDDIASTPQGSVCNLDRLDYTKGIPGFDPTRVRL